MYPDPEKFDPERFINEGSRKTRIHIPFAEGNRTCIGKRFYILFKVLRYPHKKAISGQKYQLFNFKATIKFEFLSL